MRPDPADIKQLMRDAAAQFITPRFKNLKNGEVDAKTSPNDLVTLADIEAEAFLEREFAKKYPAALFIGEEKVHRDPKVMDILQQDEASYFVVDPVDGTNNFVKGSPHFGLMVVYVEKGEVQQAYIYDILKDHFMSAVRGEGAFDGAKKMTVAPAKKVEKVGFTKRKYDLPDASGTFNIAAKEAGIKISLLGCSAHEYLNLARGNVRFYMAEHVRPWDHLAGSLILREAGGVCAKWDGTPYKPKDTGASILSAASADDWNELHRLLLQHAVKPARLTPQ